MTKWVYMWSINRSNREGRIYSGENAWRVVLKEDGNEVSDTICDELDECREVAEVYVLANIVLENQDENK